jgi:hypothetical protein
MPHTRDLLARYTERVLEVTFPSNRQAPMIEDQVAEDLLDRTERAILSLQPDPQEPDFNDQALTQVRSIVRRGERERCFPAHHRGPDPVAGVDAQPIHSVGRSRNHADMRARSGPARPP